MASADPAADFEVSLVRSSRSVREAALAALADVSFNDLTCASALPAANFDALPVSELVRTLGPSSKLPVLSSPLPSDAPAPVLGSTVPAEGGQAAHLWLVEQKVDSLRRV